MNFLLVSIYMLTVLFFLLRFYRLLKKLVFLEAGFCLP